MIKSKISLDRKEGFSFIYELVDPSNGNIRYVGKTVNPKERYRKHLTQKNNSYKNQWLKSIYPNKPIMDIKGFYPNDIVDFIEIELIDLHLKRGIKLTNITKGGDGGATFLGKKHTSKSKGLISKANKGKKRDDLINYNKLSKSKPVIQIDPETKIHLAYFVSVSMASLITGFSKTNISKFCTGSLKPSIKKVGGHHWAYA